MTLFVNIIIYMYMIEDEKFICIESANDELNSILFV